jgi:hypothetical protein
MGSVILLAWSMARGRLREAEAFAEDVDANEIENLNWG